MRRTRKSQRGQVLIIFVFAAIALIAVTGLAIDGANVFSDRRHAQNAADTAALAAALYKAQQKGDATCTNPGSTCGSTILLRALNIANDNGYPDSTVEVHIPPIDGPYSHDTYAYKASDFVQVIINSEVETFFARILGPGLRTLHNRVEAVAIAKYRDEHTAFGGSALVAMAPTGAPGTCQFNMTGGGLLTLNGGTNIFVNSDNPSCALNIQHCGQLTLSPDPSLPLAIVGGTSIVTGCTPPVTAAPASQVQFPPDPIFSPPPQCNPSFPTPHSTNEGTFRRLYPGYYSGTRFPPNPASQDYKLDPGVYCVDTSVDIKSSLIGDQVDGVVIWVTPGTAANPHNFTINAGSTVQLWGRKSGTYAGYLVYMDSTYETSPDATCTFNGNTGDTISGIFYAPNCNFKLNGTSSATGLSAQFIGYTFNNINGTTNLVFSYNGTPQITYPEVNYTGLYH